MSDSEIIVPATSITDVEHIMQGIEKGADEQAPPIPGAVVPVSEQKSTAEVISAIKIFVDPVTLRNDVSFSTNDLDSAVMNQAGMFVHYAAQKAQAGRQYSRMQAAFEILESQLDNLYRTSLKADGGKTTEKQIETAVKGDRRWWQGQCRLIDAKSVYDLAKDACSAFEQRRDMIVQTSVDRRGERQGQLRVMGTPGEMPGAASAQATAAAMIAGANKG